MGSSRCNINDGRLMTMRMCVYAEIDPEQDGLEEGAVLENSDEEILGQVDTGFLSRCVAHVSIPDWYLIILRYDTDPILV